MIKGHRSCRHDELDLLRAIVNVPISIETLEDVVETQMSAEERSNPAKDKMEQETRDVEKAEGKPEASEDEASSRHTIATVDGASVSGTSSEEWFFKRRLFLHFEVLNPRQHKARGCSWRKYGK